MRRVALTALIAGALWLVSTAGYFAVSPWLGATVGYNDAPVFFAIYYAGFAGAAGFAYRDLFAGLAETDLRGLTFPLASMALVFLAYAGFILPLLPETAWTRDTQPVEFFWATQWYFLPKSLEILFQDVLIAALVLALARTGMRLVWLSVLTALLFGGFHVTMGLSYPNPFYVARYTAAAALFGAMVPWLILRLKGGFLAVYGVHWGYYALDIALIHWVFAAPEG